MDPEQNNDRGRASGVMSDRLFRALLDLQMCNDPAGTFPIDDQILSEELRVAAQDRGFDSWVVAYHEFKADKPCAPSGLETRIGELEQALIKMAGRSLPDHQFEEFLLKYNLTETVEFEVSATFTVEVPKGAVGVGVTSEAMEALSDLESRGKIDWIVTRL